MNKQTTIGYDEAAQAILDGKAVHHALWIGICDEHARDGFALKPSPWEGPGEYQHIEFEGVSRLIRIPTGARPLYKLVKPKPAAEPASRPLPKSLHTVTVLVNVARFINVPHLNPGCSPELALDKALEVLGYGGTLFASEDPHGLQARALKLMGAR